MPIPVKRVKIGLTKATPTPLTAEALKQQLTSIGLTCPDTILKALRQNIDDVKGQIRPGAVQSYGIFTPVAPGVSAATAAGFTTLGAVKTTTGSDTTGNWEPSETGGGYATELEYIQYEQHFDWLMVKANRPSFTGIVDNPEPYHSIVPTIDGVKQMFANVATTASATLIKGLDKDAIEAVLANAIAPLAQDTTDYDKSDSRVIFLVDNYNPNTGEADAIGVLTIEWHLVIKDYKVKKQAPTHDTTITIKSRSVLYSDLDTMNADIAAAKSALKSQAFAMFAIPIKKPTVTIFPSRPPAVKDTFDQSLPKTSTTNEIEVIVLYAPDLQIIGSIDNTRSSTSTTYSQAVTEGFTFSTSQTLTITASLEVNIEVVKMGLSVAFALSFTEEWSSSRTITMTFDVPPGKKSFNYQGYMIAEILVLDAKTQTYSYQGGSARCLTNVLVSSETPLTDSTGGSLTVA